MVSVTGAGVKEFGVEERGARNASVRAAFLASKSESCLETGGIGSLAQAALGSSTGFGRKQTLDPEFAAVRSTKRASTNSSHNIADNSVRPA